MHKSVCLYVHLDHFVCLSMCISISAVIPTMTAYLQKNSSQHGVKERMRFM